jgi:hypothetical protein
MGNLFFSSSAQEYDTINLNDVNNIWKDDNNSEYRIRISWKNKSDSSTLSYPQSMENAEILLDNNRRTIGVSKAVAY